MSELERLESDTPLPSAKPDDLKRVWSLTQKMIAEHGLGVGIDAHLFSEHCDPGADVYAVFFRAALIQYMLQSGLLDDWRNGSEPAKLVFEAGAVFPLENGVQGFDPADFMDRLRSRSAR